MTHYRPYVNVNLPSVIRLQATWWHESTIVLFDEKHQVTKVGERDKKEHEIGDDQAKVYGTFSRAALLWLLLSLP